MIPDFALYKVIFCFVPTENGTTRSIAKMFMKWLVADFAF